MRIFSRLLVLFGLVVAAAPGHAAITGNWAICDSCVTRDQFEAAAVVWHNGKNGLWQVSVGNPDTGVVYTIWVANSGGTPMRSDINKRAEIEQKGYVAAEYQSSIIRASELARGYLPPGGGGGVQSISRDTEAEPVFQAVVIGSKKHILFNVSSADLASGAFSSLRASDMPEICSRVWDQESIENPKWGLVGAGRGNLVQAVEAFFGHGVQVSMVFGNGDVATFQLNPLHPDGCRYVDNTAKDRMGNGLPAPATPISTSWGAGHVSVGGGSTITPRTYSIGEYWLVCSFQGSRMVGCNVQYVSP
jgi:hypothetical protein